MKQQDYTQEQRDEYCALAQEIGQGAALRQLGFPKTHSTAKKWLDQAGIVLSNEALGAQRAVRAYWSNEQQRATASLYLKNLEREFIKKASQLSPEQYKRVGEALEKVVATLQLIDGGATSRTEHVSTTKTDAEIEALMREMAGVAQ